MARQTFFAPNLDDPNSYYQRFNRIQKLNNDRRESERPWYTHNPLNESLDTTGYPTFDELHAQLSPYDTNNGGIPLPRSANRENQAQYQAPHEVYAQMIDSLLRENPQLQSHPSAQEFYAARGSSPFANSDPSGVNYNKLDRAESQGLGQVPLPSNPVPSAALPGTSAADSQGAWRLRPAYVQKNMWSQAQQGGLPTQGPLQSFTKPKTVDEAVNGIASNAFSRNSAGEMTTPGGPSVRPTYQTGDQKSGGLDSYVFRANTQPIFTQFGQKRSGIGFG